MTIQLNPPLPFWTPKGFAHAYVMLDYGPDHDLLWTCFIVATGECWTYQNKDIRMVDNETMGRKRATLQQPQSASVGGPTLAEWMAGATSTATPPTPEK